MNGYLLDTNHCSRLLQGYPGIQQKLVELAQTPVATCVIVRGELIFMAERSERREENLHQVQSFLASLKIYSIDDEVADQYGRLKAALLRHYGPRERAKRHQARLERLGFTENDLWIAAIAQRYELTIVSADSDDFERMKTVEDLSLESWLEGSQ